MIGESNYEDVVCDLQHASVTSVIAYTAQIRKACNVEMDSHIRMCMQYADIVNLIYHYDVIIFRDR